MSSRPVTPLPPVLWSAGRPREQDSCASAPSASGRTCSGSPAQSSSEARASSHSSARSLARCARRPGEDPSRRHRRSRASGRVDGRSGRRLPAEPRGALRPRDARRPRVGAVSRRDEHRRAARVRAGGCGILIDPTDDDSVRAGLDAAAQLPRPNLAARSAAESHDVRRQAERVEELLARAAASRRLGEG